MNKNDNNTNNHKTPITVRSHKIRIIVLLSVSLFLFIYLGINIYNIQVLNYDDYKDYAKGDHEKIESKEPYRGEIRDRNGDLIVSKEISFRVSIIPFYYNRDKSKDKEDKIREISNILLDEYYASIKDQNPSIINSKIKEIFQDIIKTIEKTNKKISKNKINPYDPLTIEDHVSELTAIELYEKADRYPWLTVTPSPKREYKLEEAFAHIIGFTSPIFESEKEELLSNDRLFIPTSTIGRSGLEKIYDMELRGKIGKIARLRNSLGRSLGVERTIIPTVHGNDLYLTIDSKIQKTAYLALGNFKGSVIVSKPSTGEILAMVSSPSYNPNTYYENYKELYNDEDSPLLNRAISGIYPVGSIFKIVVTSAALELGLINKNWEYTCKGFEVVGRDNKVFKCTHVHGKVNLRRAIQVSCNAYFYNLALKVGWDNIYEYGKKYGLGDLTGIDLENEIKGYFVNEEWKKEHTSMPVWLPGDTVNGAIGQGFTAITPIQIHNIISTVVNDGYLYKPHLVKKIVDINTDDVVFEKTTREYIINDKPIISKKTSKFLKDALRDVVELKGGTARRARTSIIAPIAGKTGTVQVPDGKKDHALFTGFAPYNADNKEDIIAITVVAENAGYGGVVAVPIATAIFRNIFEGISVEKSFSDMNVPYIPPENEFEKQLSNTILVDNTNSQGINDEFILSSLESLAINTNIKTDKKDSQYKESDLVKENRDNEPKDKTNPHKDEKEMDEEVLLTSINRNSNNTNQTGNRTEKPIENSTTEFNKNKQTEISTTKKDYDNKTTQKSEPIKEEQTQKLALEEKIDDDNDIKKEQEKLIQERENLKKEQEEIIKKEETEKQNQEKEVEKAIEESGKEDEVSSNDIFNPIPTDPLADIKSIIDEEAKKIIENQEKENQEEENDEEEEDNDD